MKELEVLFAKVAELEAKLAEAKEEIIMRKMLADEHSAAERNALALLQEVDQALIGTSEEGGEGHYALNGPTRWQRIKAVRAEAIKRESERPKKHKVGCGYRGTIYTGECTCNASQSPVPHA